MADGNDDFSGFAASSSEIPARERDSLPVPTELSVGFQISMKCEQCGCVFHLSEATVVKASGVTPKAAREKIDRRAYARHGSTPLRGPCPGCGRFAKGVEGRVQFNRHKGVLVVVLCILGVIGLLSLAGSNNHNAVKTEAIAGVVSLVAILATGIHASIILRNPNRTPHENLPRAVEAVRTGKVIVARPGEPADVEDRSAATAAIALFAVGVLAAVLGSACTIYRVLNGWEYQPNLHPAVCGPGDRVRCAIDGQMMTVGGNWLGQPIATLEQVGVANEPIPIASDSRGWNWDPTQIRVSQNAKESGVQLWADVVIPPEQELADKLVRIRIDMKVVYPKIRDQHTFERAENTANQVIETRLVSPGAGQRYLAAFKWGTLMASFLTILVSGLIVWMAHRGADAPANVTLHPVSEKPHAELE